MIRKETLEKLRRYLEREFLAYIMKHAEKIGELEGKQYKYEVFMEAREHLYGPEDQEECRVMGFIEYKFYIIKKTKTGQILETRIVTYKQLQHYKRQMKGQVKLPHLDWPRRQITFIPLEECVC